MAKVELYSERQRKFRGEVPTVYIYDYLPEPLKVQIVYIWEGSIKQEYISVNSSATTRLSRISQRVVATLHREYGVSRLPGTKDFMYKHPHFGEVDYFRILSSFFLNEEDVEKSLDSVELFFYIAEKSSRVDADRQIMAQGIEELNSRFKQHGVGYQLKDGQILRIDSEFTHSEIIEPALRLLEQEIYSGAQKEFLKAHKHYRERNYEESLNECLKAFESVMKVICDKRGWEYENNATASQLIKTCFKNKLIPEFWQSHYESLQNLLKTGVPTGRNKLSAHGGGSNPRPIPDYLVAYMLHTTASTILFLAEAENNLSQANAD